MTIGYFFHSENAVSLAFGIKDYSELKVLFVHTEVHGKEEYI
jgi:hypothetical protein